MGAGGVTQGSNVAESWGWMQLGGDFIAAQYPTGREAQHGRTKGGQRHSYSAGGGVFTLRDARGLSIFVTLRRRKLGSFFPSRQ